MLRFGTVRGQAAERLAGIWRALQTLKLGAFRSCITKQSAATPWKPCIRARTEGRGVFGSPRIVRRFYCCFLVQLQMGSNETQSCLICTSLIIHSEGCGAIFYKNVIINYFIRVDYFVNRNM